MLKLTNSQKQRKKNQRIKMKIFQTLQNNFKWMNISPNRVPFGLVDFEYIVCSSSWILSLYLYITDKATTERQQTRSIVLMMLVTLVLISYLNYRLNSHNIFKTIHQLEHDINESKQIGKTFDRKFFHQGILSMNSQQSTI